MGESFETEEQRAKRLCRFVFRAFLLGLTVAYLIAVLLKITESYPEEIEWWAIVLFPLILFAIPFFFLWFLLRFGIRLIRQTSSQVRRMKHRREILLALASLAFAASLISVIAARPIHSITESTVKLIQVGMTREEVESIFGVPPGVYKTDANIVFMFEALHPYRDWHYKNKATSWTSNKASIVIHFDDNGRVEAAFPIQRILIDNETIWEKIRGRLGL